MCAAPLGAGQGSGSRRVDQHIGVGDEPASGRRIAVAGEVQDCAAFAGVEVLEQPGPIGVGFAAGKRAPLPQRIAFWCFDFRDIGAEVDEQFAAVRT